MNIFWVLFRLKNNYFFGFRNESFLIRLCFNVVNIVVVVLASQQLMFDAYTMMKKKYYFRSF